MRAKVGAVVEDAKLNYDLSFYAVKCGFDAFTVRISLIERYAYIMNSANFSLLTAEDQASINPGREIIRLLTEVGAILLDKGGLIKMVKLEQDYQVNVFRALFFDSDFSPWLEALLDLKGLECQKS